MTQIRFAPSLALDAFLFLPVNPSYTSTLLKTENKKINLLNHPRCGKAAREGFRGPDSATVIRLIPRRTKRRCHILVRSDRAIPGALRFSFFCAASAVYITYCVNRILTWFPESSQRRHKTKRRVTLNHSLCGKAAK